MVIQFQLLADCITVIFFLIILSYYGLLFRRPVRGKFERKFDSLTVIVPAHNEARYIEASLRSVLKAPFVGEKEVLVVDDGSTDTTSAVVGQLIRQLVGQSDCVRLISTKHSGKSASLNLALAQAKGDLIAIVDGDSEVAENAFEEMRLDLERHNVVATTCPVLVKNRNRGVLMWFHIELLYGALLRSIMCKVDANVVNAFGMYRKQELIVAILRFDRKIDLWHLLPLTFMTPFWWAITLVQAYSLPEILRAQRCNIWSKQSVDSQRKRAPLSW